MNNLKPLWIVVVIAAVAGAAFVVLHGNPSGGAVYTNTKYAYTLRAPSRWKLITDIDGLTYPGMKPGTPDRTKAGVVMVRSGEGKGSALLTLTATANPDHRSPQDWYSYTSRDKTLPYPYPQSIVASAEETTVNGTPAYKVTITDAPHSYTYFITHGDYVYVLQFAKYPAPGEDPSLPQADFDYLLQNFVLQP